MKLDPRRELWREHERWRLRANVVPEFPRRKESQADQDDADDVAGDTVFMLTLGGVLLLLLVGIAALAGWWW